MKNFFVLYFLLFVTQNSIAYETKHILLWKEPVPQISSPIRSMESTQKVLKNSNSKQGIDTIYYDDGAIAANWYGVNYFGVRFVPEAECNVLTALINLTETSGNSCNVSVRPDASGSPGTIQETKNFNASAGWNSINFSSTPVYSNPFWLTFYVPTDSTGPFVCGDANGGERSYYSGDGNSWKNVQSEGHNSDFLIRAIVEYGATGTPEIRVDPTFLDFYIESSKYGKSPLFHHSITPSLHLHPSSYISIVPGQVIIGYHDNIDARNARLKDLGIANKGVTLIDRGLPLLNCILVKVSEDIEEMKKFIEHMQKKPIVKYAEPNRKWKLFGNPNDPDFNTYQWDKRSLNAPAAWDYGWGSDAISIGILDQGTEYTHPDLKDRYGTPVGYDKLDLDDNPKPESGESHGTHCSGNAAATINNGIGIAGISNSRLYALRVGNAGGIDVYAAGQAIAWCMSKNVNILSMSFGGPDASSYLASACQSAWDGGCILCAASGNDGAEITNYPAGYSTVISVGSIGSTDQRSSFSTYGSHMELVAPGENIRSTVPGGGYQHSGWSGTSMACPQVAGCAALVWSADPTLSNQEVRNILNSTAVDIAPSGRDKYTGYGKPDLLAAVEAAMGSLPSDTGMITVYNQASATGNLYVSDITWKEAWVKSVSTKSFTLSPGGSKGVDIIVGGKLSSGTYYDTLWISSNDPDDNPYPVVLRLRVDVGIEEDSNYQLSISSYQLSVYPNPFTQKTVIRVRGSCSYQHESPPRITIYDLSGKLVKSLPITDYRSPITVVGKDSQGKDLSSGIYFIQLKAGDYKATRKLILLR